LVIVVAAATAALVGVLKAFQVAVVVSSVAVAHVAVAVVVVMVLK